MKFVENVNTSLILTQMIFFIFGVWTPKCTGWKKRFFPFYSFAILSALVGIYTIIQVGDLIQVWGDLPLMTATTFLLFSNIVLVTKLVNTIWRQEEIREMMREAHDELSSETQGTGRAIVKSCNSETRKQLSLFFALSYMTVFLWAASAEKNELPFRAWYPFDTSKSPAYQLAYAHQIIAILLEATINICLDTLVTSVICQCRCRLRLLALTLRTLSDGLEVTNTGLLTFSSNRIVNDRLNRCVMRHQAVLFQVNLLQKYFSLQVLAQFTLSMMIICVTAYQLAFEATSLVRIFSMLFYLVVMMLQVFLYCYQGNQLVLDSEGVLSAGYEGPWYTYSIPTRRSLLVLMTRTRSESRLKAGGLAELSLRTFMSIIKASYTFYTVLQQVVED